MSMIGFEILTGISMHYFNFPFFTQPLHLLFATILLGAQTYFLIDVYKLKQNDI